MEGKNIPPSQEVEEKLAEIQKGGKAEDIDILLKDLEQHDFFTNMDLETVETQKIVRGKIETLLEKFEIVETEVEDRLRMLHDWLAMAIEKKELRPSAPEEAPTITPGEREEIPGLVTETFAPEKTEEVAEPGVAAATVEAGEVGEAEAEAAKGPDVEPGMAAAEEAPPVALREKESGKPEAPKTPTEIISLFKDILKDPDDFNADLDKIKDPAVLAIIELLKARIDRKSLWPGDTSFDKNKFDELVASLYSSEKVPKASLRTAISKYQKNGWTKGEKGIKTLDELDRKIAEYTVKTQKLQAEAEDLKQEIDNYAITKGEKGLNPKQAEKFDKANVAYKTKRTNLRTEQNILNDLKAIEPYFGEIRLNPRQILMKMLHFIHGEEKSLHWIGSETDSLIQEQEEELKESTATKLDFVSRLIKPSLKATLKEFGKINELKELKPEDLENLVNLRKNPDGLEAWMEELGENAKNTVPVIMAYLQMAIVEKTLNVLSRGQAVNLLENLRAIRNKMLTKKINNDPELANAKAPIKMQAYLKELNTWDEKTVAVNRNILDDLTRKAYLKKLSYAFAGGVTLGYAWPLLSLPAIGAAASYLGWGNLATLGTYGIGKKIVKTYFPEKQWAVKHIGTRAVGLFVLGPIGLAAPELLSGLKFLFTKRKEIKAGAQTGLAGAKTAGKGAKAVGKGAWGVAKGAGKALAYPIKKLAEGGGGGGRQFAPAPA